MTTSQDFRASKVWNQDKPIWKDIPPIASGPRVVVDAQDHQAPQLMGMSHRVSRYEVHKVFDLPWQIYEPIVGINLGHHMCFARRRNKKVELVNIQRLAKQNGSADSLVDSMSQNSHPSFLSLLECYYYAEDAYLVWEPVEISVNHILASQCPITEAEISAIVKPVLMGIKYLCDRGKALAALTADAILITPTGEVKIANVEHSCNITTREMDAASIKLFSLAEIVERLMKKNPPPFTWSDALQELPGALRKLNVEQLAYCTHLQQPVAHGELKALMSIVNKTASHKVEYFDRTSQS